MHQALYRKYRPATFDDVAGQDHITTVLNSEVENHTTSHAYLFCGSRGTGKTTCAKILSKAVNCLSPVGGDPCGKCENCLAIEAGLTTDILEMDAASNTGVDYIRDIKDAVMYAPSMLKNRVYIIDEVHMLSDGAFNALLKTLEEPPSNVVFILATTEAQKIPATILSRCQRFEFRRIAGNVIAGRLKTIAEKEGIALDDDAAYLIARIAQGGMRDAISLLELCSAGKDGVTVGRVEALSGGTGRKTVQKTVEAILDKNGAELFEIVSGLYSSSGDLGSFWQELIGFYRDMLCLKTLGKMNAEELRRDILDLTENEFAALKTLADRFRYETLIYHSEVLDAALPSVGGKTGSSGRIAAEIALVKLASGGGEDTVASLADRVARLEDALNGGRVLSAAQRPAPAPEKKPAAVRPAAPAEEKREIEEKTPAAINKQEETPSLDVKEADVKEERETEDQMSLFGAEELPAEARGTTLPPAKAHELKGFIEVLRAYMKDEPGAAAFFSGTKAYLREDGFVCVPVQSIFAKSYLDSRKADEAIEGLLKVKMNIDATVVFITDPSEIATDVLDELNT